MLHPLQIDMWSVPRYFEYEIVAGPGDAVQDWTRIFTPGSWRTISSTIISPPDALPSTFREWKKFYIFETCYILDGTGGTSPDEQLRTTSLPTHYCWLGGNDYCPLHHIAFDHLTLGINHPLLRRRQMVPGEHPHHLVEHYLTH